MKYNPFEYPQSKIDWHAAGQQLARQSPADLAHLIIGFAVAARAEVPDPAMLLRDVRKLLPSTVQALVSSLGRPSA
jgi:hypothetical protein